MQWLIRLSALTLIVASFANGESKPNFTGTWKINFERSVFGPIPQPKSQTNTVDHKEPRIKQIIESDGGDGAATTETAYTTDGKECVNDIHGSKLVSKLHWDGETLVVDSVFSTPAGDLQVRDQWALSKGGKVLTIDRHISTGSGDGEVHMVFDKQ